jgi:hypothetical protein
MYASLHGHFTPDESTPTFYHIGGWMGPQNLSGGCNTYAGMLKEDHKTFISTVKNRIMDEVFSKSPYFRNL